MDLFFSYVNQFMYKFIHNFVVEPAKSYRMESRISSFYSIVVCSDDFLAARVVELRCCFLRCYYSKSVFYIQYYWYTESTSYYLKSLLDL